MADRLLASPGGILLWSPHGQAARADGRAEVGGTGRRRAEPACHRWLCYVETERHTRSLVPTTRTPSCLCAALVSLSGSGPDQSWTIAPRRRIVVIVERTVVRQENQVLCARVCKVRERETCGAPRAVGPVAEEEERPRGNPDARQRQTAARDRYGSQVRISACSVSAM